MRAVGVIVEYNPFHNGHAYHLQASKEAADADVVIAVMSGNFLQRGEPALVSKWYRTKMALLNGADLVFELPYSFAVQKAEIFANGAVSLLEAAGVEYLCFGSENGNIAAFFETITFLEKHQAAFNENIKRFIQTGVSYPKAVALSFQKLNGAENYLDLAQPNNILGFQYIKAILQQDSRIKPLTISRKNAQYHDEHFSSATIASATSIRKAIFTTGHKDGAESIAQYIPDTTKQLLKEYNSTYRGFHHWGNYWDYLQYQLITSTTKELQEIYEMEEGIENRLIAAAHSAASFQEFMENIKTKRYTWTRLQRLAVHVLTHAGKAMMKTNSEKAAYLRLLGMTATGREYLNKMKKHFSLPIVAKPSAYKGDELLHDIKAARVYACAFPQNIRQAMLQQEFTQPPIYINK
ncbi:nucleotidyltransferase [Bacillus rubiinfantis]|uniref:nucleotidyltransferase n=1 Tax=Bacillus rubiinfantis TaxID=1499680 RepID=UPI0005A63A10|nr:nucleotidyltransferase [Bacillus rubiinfantis]